MSDQKDPESHDAFILAETKEGTLVVRENGQVGYMTPHQDGMPIDEGVEIVHSEPTGPHTVRTTTIYKRGPSKASTPVYRSNYDSIFGEKKEAWEIN